MEGHRDATDNKMKKDLVVLTMKVAVMVLLVLVASTNKALLSNKCFLTPSQGCTKD
jgi:hypothetical protein